MYNVGFGDCFLLRVPAPGGGIKNMLVDCGYHSHGKGPFTDAKLVEQIQEHLNGQPLSVVVATHRHQDHISGFGQSLWKKIPVEEVWLPFTAHAEAARDEPALAAWEALRASVSSLVDDQGRLVPALAGTLPAVSKDQLEELESCLWNARTNADGMENLLQGMKRADGGPARRRFLPPKGRDVPWQFESEALPGVKVHVLGPTRDPEHRRGLAVPVDWAMLGRAAAATAGAPGPFGPEWRMAKLPPRLPFTKASLETIRKFNDGLFHAASAVDSFVNGESVVLLLEVGAARLLLAGDAEVGAWTKILEDDAARALASSLTFFKVAHHGSRNATPLPFVRENLNARTPVMISTQEGAGPFRRGIPLTALLEELAKCGAPTARSDRPQEARSFEASDDGLWIDCKVPC
jgi:beta-lactamase superfamily II metal-dependent hydrolase